MLTCKASKTILLNEMFKCQRSTTFLTHDIIVCVLSSRLGQVHTQARAMSDTSKYVLTIFSHCNHFVP